MDKFVHLPRNKLTIIFTDEQITKENTSNHHIIARHTFGILSSATLCFYFKTNIVALPLLLPNFLELVAFVSKQKSLRLRKR